MLAHAYHWSDAETLACPLAKAFCLCHAIAAREGSPMPGPTLAEMEMLRLIGKEGF